MKASAFHPFRTEGDKAEYLALYAKRAREWPIPSETKLISTPAGQTYVRISGHPANPPLVLLHGVRGNSLMWIPNIQLLSTHFRTYALDTINDTGLSVQQARITKPKDLLQWLDDVVTELVPDGPVSMVGMSQGGWLTSMYALQIPSKLHKIILLAPAATVLPVSLSFIYRAILTLLPNPTFRKRFYYWLLQDIVLSGAVGKAKVDESVSDWAIAERCFSPLSTVPATILTNRELASLQVPCLYLVGENEKIYPAKKALARLSRHAPQIKTALIPKAGHDLWIVQAELVTKTIVDFLLNDETNH